MVGLTLWSLLLAVPVSISSPLRERSAITDCLSLANVPQSLPGSTNFTQAIKPFNLRLPYTPVAVAVPSTVAQVQAAVSCGASLGITISPKSGGHSYASHGIGGENGHLMVDMKLFNSVALDNTTGIADIQPGARLGNVATALWNQGKRAISHGTCPGVGVGGHVLHGGYGYASHTYGLALDNLIGATLVLANSSVITANANVNSDVFWALRGAGSSYGIVTSLKFQTFVAPNNNTVFNYNANFNADQARKAVAILQEYANTTMSLEMNMRYFVRSYGGSISGVYYGNRTAFNAEITPLLSKLGITGGTVTSKGWIDGLKEYAYANLETTMNYDEHDTFFAKSLMTDDATGLTPAAMDAFVNYWYTTARANTRAWYFIIDLHGGRNSYISSIPNDATSYAHRNSLLKFQFYDAIFGASYPSNGFSFLDGWVKTITNTIPNGTYGMYINYADPTLPTEDSHRLYYTDNYDRLSQIKAVWDPRKVFGNPQAISPAQLPPISSSTIASYSSTTTSLRTTTTQASSTTTSLLPTTTQPSSTTSLVITSTTRISTTSLIVTTISTQRVSSTTVTTTRSAAGPEQTKYGQCGGEYYSGPTVCVAGSTCKISNQWYSQCL